MSVTAQKLTSEQFLRMTAPDEVEMELSEGQIVVMTKPGYVHQRVVRRLSRLLEDFCERTGWGEFVVDMLVRLSEYTSRAPDLSGVRRERASIIGADRLEQPPDIAIEVHSRNRAEDRGPKFEQYREAGVGAYWMIDPASRSLEAYRLQDGEYVLVWHGRNSAVFRPEELPGFELPLELLW
ncbi:MAG: Uma2 family endonuclease [Bacillota bacterium]